MPIVGTSGIYQDEARYVAEADAYLRSTNPGLFPEGRDLSNFGHNDALDAFRHAYVSGRFAQDYDAFQAFMFGTYHEVTNWNDGPERHMDFWNNSKGIQYAGETNSPAALAARIDQAIRDGELTLAPGQTPELPPDPEYPYSNSDTTDPTSESGGYGFGDDSSESFIDKLKDRFSDAKQTVSPLILDLDGDGVETINIQQGIHFDHDGNGFAEQTGWVGKNDGLLVRDLNGNGTIDNGHELFGNNTQLVNGSYAENGFAALSDLDSNHDGLISSADVAFSQLRIWKDLNSNGVTDSGELLSLSAAGVVSIATTHLDSNALDGNGNEHRQHGAYTTTGGATRTVDDVWFVENTASTVNMMPVEVSVDIAALPEIVGFGNVPSLHQAMALDTSGHLKSLVQGFAAETDKTARSIILQQIIFAWTGVEFISPTSRGEYVADARTVYAIEAVLGQGFLQNVGQAVPSSDPLIYAAPKMLLAYNELSAYVDARLMSQTHLSSLYDSLTLQWSADGSKLSWDVSEAVALMQAAYDANDQSGIEMLKDFVAGLNVAAGINGDAIVNALRLAGNVEATGFLREVGSLGASLILDTAGNNWLIGGSEAEVFDGGVGNDSITGGAGNNTYRFGRGDGQDTINSYFDETVGRESIVQFKSGVLSSDVAVTRSDNALILAILGTSDQIIVEDFFFSSSSAIYYSPVQKVVFSDGTIWNQSELFEKAVGGIDAAKLIVGTVYNDVIHGGDGADSLFGNSGSDYITGGAGDDHLYGEDGDDVVSGGAGNDIIKLGNGANTMVFNRGDGRDTVLTSGFEYQNVIQFGAGISVGDIKLALDANNTTFSGDMSIYGTTDSIDNSAPDLSVKFADGSSWALGFNEDQYSQATTLSMADKHAMAVTDSARSTTIIGTEFSNYINGGGGIDTLVGGAGDDIYVVDTKWVYNGYSSFALHPELKNFDDTVTESVGGGYDTIVAYNVYSATLPDNVESLIIDGFSGPYTAGDWIDSYDIRRKFFGNSLNNVIDAQRATSSLGQGWIMGQTQINQGELLIDGGLGADTMYGGISSSIDNPLDTRFVVDDVGDVVIAGSGKTTIESYINYTLAANFNDLFLVGTNAITGMGNALSNTFNGRNNSAANTLIGGIGDDTYIVDLNDIVQEMAGEGIDTVRSLWSYTLGNNIENLVLEGSNTYGVGNSLDNILTGNESDNSLTGGAGNDQLRGGNGDDTYLGFSSTTGLDVITDEGGADAISYASSSNVNVELLQVARTGSDLYVAINSANAITIKSWYDDASNVIEQLNLYENGLLYSYSSAQLQGRADGINTGPVAGVVAAQNGLTDQLFSFQVPLNAFFDIESQHSLSYAATLADGSPLPSWLVFNASTRTFSGTPPQSSVGTMSLKITATDAGGLSASAVFGVGIARGPIIGTAGNDTLVGDAADNTMQGLAGDDYLDGAAGADTMSGGLGNDTYVVERAADVVIEAANEGIDTVQSSITYTLSANVENLTLTGSAALNGTGNTLDNVLTGNSGNNTLTGLDGNDTLDGGSSGTDALLGGLGNDTYIVTRSSGITITESANQGTDTVLSAVTYTLGSNLENLTLTGTAVINGTGNTLGNVLTGNSVNNTLDGGAGADTLVGGAGNDTYVVDNVGDVITENVSEGTDLVQSSVTYTLSANVDNLTLTGATAINGMGNSLANTITGNSGNNVLDGGAGADTLVGGAGNDTYVVDNAADVVTEAASAGTDIVQSSVTYTLGSNVENLTLIDTFAINATGNTLANTLVGNSANNILDGGAGNDTMLGGLGNDTYVVDSSSDVVTENANEGTDAVQSSVTYTLGANVENLTLTGSTAINATGNTLANVLTGNSANNTLDGGIGADTLMGGAGNDTYVVDNVGDVITENASEGTDLVQSSDTYTLSANVENLTLTGTSALNATGNTLANTLTGNSGNNVLDGGAGADTLVGGAGNDTYMVDNTGDVVTEAASAGTDLVQSSVTYTLATNVENLTLTGTTAINGTGNTLANVLTGNSGSNVLDGGTGADSLLGGLGNDTYVIDNTGDVVSENASEGTDLVQSSITYTLGNNIENLLLTGTTAINGTGNTLDNILTGNSANNTLTGGAGNDTLDGGTGTDTMVGGAGNDTYYVDATTDVTTEAANEGIDVVNSSVTLTLAANIELLFQTGSTAINGTGNALANLLRGNTANNTLVGGGGTDILEGGDGNDILSNTSGNTLLNGGAGTDTLTGTANNDLLIGGTGNDALTTGQGADIIAFNKGDGQDTLAVSTTKDNTLSVGGGTAYADLLFQKSGNNLILKVGSADQITFTNYYAATANRSVNTLQVILEGSTDYNAASTNAMYNKKIETFDFGGLVTAFDAALAANPSLTSWSLNNALLSQYLSGSDTAAMGGDLAYQYGRYGNEANLSYTPALGLLGSANFGTTAQTLQSQANLQDASPRLS